MFACIIFSGDGNSICTRGFPDVPVRQVRAQTHSNFIETRIIPDMKFNCNATIFGFIVAGQMLKTLPHAKIQIWRKFSDNEYKIAPDSEINLNPSTLCVHTCNVIPRAAWCVLDKSRRVRVQPGDILGLELPKTDNASEILFLDTGPVNYVYSGRLKSSVTLSNETMFTKVKQLPQIVFNLTSGNKDTCKLQSIAHS